jgi:hypothetical protein
LAKSTFLGCAVYTSTALLIANPVILLGVLGISSIVGFAVEAVKSAMYAKEVATIRKTKENINKILIQAIEYYDQQ